MKALLVILSSYSLLQLSQQEIDTINCQQAICFSGSIKDGALTGSSFSKGFCSPDVGSNGSEDIERPLFDGSFMLEASGGNELEYEKDPLLKLNFDSEGNLNSDVEDGRGFVLNVGVTSCAVGGGNEIDVTAVPLSSVPGHTEDAVTEVVEGSGFILSSDLGSSRSDYDRMNGRSDFHFSVDSGSGENRGTEAGEGSISLLGMDFGSGGDGSGFGLNTDFGVDETRKYEIEYGSGLYFSTNFGSGDNEVDDKNGFILHSNFESGRVLNDQVEDVNKEFSAEVGPVLDKSNKAPGRSTSVLSGGSELDHTRGNGMQHNRGLKLNVDADSTAKDVRADFGVFDSRNIRIDRRGFQFRECHKSGVHGGSETQDDGGKVSGVDFGTVVHGSDEEIVGNSINFIANCISDKSDESDNGISLD